jgi:hypothetical protein
MLVQTVIFWLLLLDSLCANFVAWFGRAWYVHNFRLVSRFFPLAKGWPALYLALVLWIGFLLGVIRIF